MSYFEENSQAQHPSSHANDKMDITTILLIFLMAFLNSVFLISLLVIFIRRIKQIYDTKTIPYYYMVFLYIVGKMIILGFLQAQIISGIQNEFIDIETDNIEKYLKFTIIIADLSLVEMFLISFQTYMSICFKILAMDNFKKIFKGFVYIIGSVVLIIEFVILTLLFFDVLNYDVVNTINAIFNLLSIISFLSSFFYLNFKMSGLMIDTEINSLIKKIYGVVLSLLLSRFLMAGLQTVILIQIKDGTFLGFIATIEENQGKYITYGLCFICYFVFILITEGIPMIMSLRTNIIRAFHRRAQQQQDQNFRQSMITSNSDLNEHLIDSSSQFDNKDEIELIVEFKAFKIIESLPSTTTMWNTMKASIGERMYILRQIRAEVSNYIVEDIMNQIEEVKELNIKPLNKVGFFTQAGSIFLYQRHRPIDFDQMIDRCKTLVDQLKLALKIALAIQKFHMKQIAHGCIKPSNIHFDLADNVYFLGYGLQTLKKYFSLTTDYTNKSFCTAIELLRDRNTIIIRPKKSSDIYSFGMIFYEIITKNKDYRQMEIQEVKKKFGQEHFRPKIPENVQGNVKNLMRKCWEADPLQRPYIGYVIDVLRRLIH